MRRISFLVGGLILVFGLISPLIVGAQTYPTQDEYVTDAANVLSEQTEAQLEELAREADYAGYGQIAIITVQSIDPLTIEEYSIHIADEWKPGDKELDNGLIFLLAIDQRKTRIEVGQGLEGDLNDAKVGRILDEYAVPYFKENDWEGGVVATSQALFTELEQIKFPESAPQESEQSGSALLFLLVFCGVVIIGFIVMVTPNEDDDAIFFGILGAIASAGGSGSKRGGGGFSGGGASR